MKRKTFIAILAIAMVLVLSLAILTACNNKKHDFSSKWEYDETSHWHECMTKKHSDVADKADHTFDAGVVTTQPTEAAEGVKTLTCTVCGYQKTESVPKLEHTFDMGNWKFDEQTHWHPATCAHTDLKKDEAEHVWNEGVITTQPTETTEGVKTYTCTVCGNTKTATIGKLDHEHTFDMERWDHDAENHWHPATCAHTSEKKDLGAHVWNEGVVTTQPTETTEGVKTYTCTVCGNTKTATIGTLDHKHTFDTERWDHDAENHWHPATCAHTSEKKDLAAHDWNEGVITKPADYGVEGEKTFTCTTCSATRKEPIAAPAAKDNEIVLKEGKTLGKEYNGEVVLITKDDFVIEGNRELAFMFKVKGAEDDAYAATAPKKAGEYTVKVSVAATAEWKAATKTFDFEIAKKELTGAAATKAYDGNVTIEATPDGVVAGDAVTATITMDSKNVGAIVKEVALAGADKDNYVLDKTKVTASITKKDITKDIPHMNYFYNATTSLFLYNGSTGGYGTIYGDAVIMRIIFASKDAGTTNITGVSISGTDGGNYYIDHTKLSGTIVQTSLGLVGINFKIFKFGDNYYSVPLKVTENHADMSGFNDDVTIKMIKYNGTHTIGETWTLTNADSDCFEITGADAKNYKKVMFNDEEDFACTATLAVDESIPELTNQVYNVGLGTGTYWYKKDVEAGNKTLVYDQSKMKINVYMPDGNNATVIDNEIIVSQKTTLYFYVVVTKEAFRGPRVDNSTTTFDEMTIGNPYSLPKDKKYLLKVSLPQNGYYQITRARSSTDSYSFYDEQGNKLTPHKYDGRAVIRKSDGYIDYFGDHTYTIANFGDSVKVVYISISGSDTSFNNYITVSKTKDIATSETGKYLEGEAKYFAGQLGVGKITIKENDSTNLSARKLTYKVYDADMNEIQMNEDGSFDIPANGEYLIEVINKTKGEIASVKFSVVEV